MAQLAARGMRADVDTGGPPPRTRLFDLSVGLVEDVRERATVCDSAESFSPRFQVALPYRDFFVWHVGNEDVVGDANQALFITGGEEYRMSHPVRGGYAELIITPAECIVSELADATRGGLRPRVVPAAQPLFGPAPAVLSGAFSLLGKWIEG